MNIHFSKLTEPNPGVVDVFNRWENDPDLIPLTRPNQNRAELERQEIITAERLKQRLENNHIYLIFLENRLVGEMNYMIDPQHLFKKEQGTAWLGITIGEHEGRGRGIGHIAIHYLEEQMMQQGLNRVELGVFEFNLQAQKLYQKLGYQEIGRIERFTFWKDKMWSDIRMEKYLKGKV
ncbi:GNAT family N-acetyltransferase [Pseudalkalibacillus caeni]|uniref:GNAT family N-acetyltransferase n=1 Tax=Exobacillus caeni TaxID=2574798 RepID=A0A5R9F4Y4_9BACL|nr:GNAT family N-acetyltransferase [Pseudalkalibacillus caeni]TLS38091.1 GNAT family N-acetyltransferase [Pseudalkalibacillus caeni]